MADRNTTQAVLGTDDIQALERLRAAHARIRAELAKVIIGQDEVRGGTVVLRYMDKGEQETIPLDKAPQVLSQVVV